MWKPTFLFSTKPTFIFYHLHTDRTQILHEIKDKHLEGDAIASFMEESRWVDYQAIFSEHCKAGRAVGLEEALDISHITIDGRLHDGLSDAINTAKIIDLLEHNPDLEVTPYEIIKEIKTEALNFSMGDLFKGLNLQLAG